jgi:hypothetical protein
MKRRIHHFRTRHLLPILFCLIALIALVGPASFVSSGSVAQQGNGAAQPSAPTANFVCMSGQTLATGGTTFGRPANVFTTSTGCNNDASGLSIAGGTQLYKAFAFNVTGCTGTLQLVAQTCAALSPGTCGATATNFDTVLFVYQKDNGAPGTLGDAVFTPADPIDAGDPTDRHLRSANNNGCGNQSTVTVNICPGIFVVVVSGNIGTDMGTFNLLVTVTGTGTCNVTGLPTLTQMDLLAANGYAEGTNINWKTGMEVDNLGFNVYREEGGKRTRVNSQMIAGSALQAGPGVNLKSGRSYSWTDTSAKNGDNAVYWVEDVGLDGQSSWHGPVAVDQSKPRDGQLPPAKGRISTLSNLGSDAEPSGVTLPLARAAKPQEASAAQAQAHSELATQPAVKLAVNREGWYRVTQPELVAAGLDPNASPQMLRLFADGKEQPFIVNSQAKGRLATSDFIEFYGIGLDSAVTDTRTYWLVAGSQPGLRMAQTPGKGSKQAAASFPYTVERRDHTIYFSALRNGDQESFFGAVIARNAVDQAMALSHIDRSASAEATLEVALQGVTQQAHRVRVDVNDSVVGEINFNAQAAGTTRIDLKAAKLKEGQNIVRLTPLGGDQDVSLVNYVRVTYGHTYTADNDALRFTLAKKQQVTIDGFSSSAIRVIDISNPDGVQEVAARVQRQGSGYAVTVAAPGAGKSTLLAFADGQVKRPVAATFNQPSNLRSTAAGADFVIVSHRDFINSLKPLVALRESEGLSVMVVDVEDVYDEFSFGEKSPQALKDFLSFAVSNWKTAPRFAMLVGDASYDPKDYQGFGNSDFVPTKMIDTQLMKTSSDAWLADFNNDGAEDIALGRLSVRTADEAAQMVARIIGYNQSRSADGVLLISDQDSEGYSFQNSAAQLRALVPANLKVQEIDRGTMDDATTRSTIIEALNRGQKIVNYSGHGNVNQWSGNILTNDDADQLLNDQSLPLFITMTCLNGYFQDPALDSLAESLMQARRGGAIAVWSSTGMTPPYDQARINQQLYRLLFSPGLGGLRLGEAIAKAKTLETSRDVRLTWVLLGDPTLRIK